MAIETVREGEALIAKAEGRISSVNALKFQEELDAAFVDADRLAILDLEQLSYISSAGLRVILVTAKGLQGRSIKFALCSLSESVLEIFQVSGFDKIIPVRDSQAAAIEALSSKGPLPPVPLHAPLDGRRYYLGALPAWGALPRQ